MKKLGGGTAIRVPEGGTIRGQLPRILSMLERNWIADQAVVGDLENSQ